VRTANAWTAGLGFIALLAAALALPRIARTPEELEARRKQVEGLSPSAKRELQRKKAAFDQLQPSEKERRRHLDAQISGHPQAAELRQVLERYGQWFASLTARQREDLRKQPVDQRIASIVELWQGEQDQRLARHGLTKSDAKIIFDWWNQFTINHSARLEATIPEHERERFENLRNDDPRREFIRRGHALRSLDRIFTRWPPEDFDLLINRLSNANSAARSRLLDQELSSDQRIDLLVTWVRESVIHELRPPPPSQQDVQRIIERMPPEERKEWEQLPREEITRRLRERWAHQWWRMFTRGSRHGFDGERRPWGGRDRRNDDEDRRPRGWDNRDDRDRGRDRDGGRRQDQDDDVRRWRRDRLEDRGDRGFNPPRNFPHEAEAETEPPAGVKSAEPPAGPLSDDSGL
jgi:hypothetical protein